MLYMAWQPASFKAQETLGFGGFAIWPPVFAGAVEEFVFRAARCHEASGLRYFAVSSMWAALQRMNVMRQLHEPGVVTPT